jgi:hypothetical protein
MITTADGSSRLQKNIFMQPSGCGSEEYYVGVRKVLIAWMHVADHICDTGKYRRFPLNAGITRSAGIIRPQGNSFFLRVREYPDVNTEHDMHDNTARDDDGFDRYISFVRAHSENSFSQRKKASDILLSK